MINSWHAHAFNFFFYLGIGIIQFCGILFSKILIRAQEYECYNANSCAFSSIILNTSTNIDIQCHGYRSCIEANIIQTVIASDIDCDGSYSCYKANLIQHIGSINNEEDIFCM